MRLQYFLPPIIAAAAVAYKLAVDVKLIAALSALALLVLLAFKLLQQNTYQEIIEEQEIGNQPQAEQQAPANQRDQVRRQKRREEREQRAQLVREMNRSKEDQVQRSLERWQKEQEESQERERLQKETLQKLKEQEEKRDKELFEKWQGQFEILQEGNQKLTKDQEQARALLLQGKIFQIIQAKKYVLLQEISQACQLRVAQVVTIIEELEKQGRLDGVFDERGKYLNVVDRQYKELEQLLQKRGRISRRQLLEQANKIIAIADSQNGEFVAEFNKNLTQSL